MTTSNVAKNEQTELANFTRNILLFIDGYSEVYGKGAKRGWMANKTSGLRWNSY